MFLTPKRIKKSKGDNQRTAAHSGGGGGGGGGGMGGGGSKKSPLGAPHGLKYLKFPNIVK